LPTVQVVEVVEPVRREAQPWFGLVVREGAAPPPAERTPVAIRQTAARPRALAPGRSRLFLRPCAVVPAGRRPPRVQQTFVASPRRRAPAAASRWIHAGPHAQPPALCGQIVVLEALAAGVAVRPALDADLAVLEALSGNVQVHPC